MNREILMSGLAGGVTALVIWFVADRVISAKLTSGGVDLLRNAEEALKRAAEVEVPAQVRIALEAKLNEVGLDRATGQRINRALAYADRLGLIGIDGGRVRSAGRRR